MGDYLSAPITSKESEDGENNRLRFGASSMQGWRKKQEDAHNCIIDYDDNSSLFAVYDGHLGREVSEYSSKHFPDFLRRTEDYAKGNFGQALKRAFLGFDETLANPKAFSSVLKEVTQNTNSEGNLIMLRKPETQSLNSRSRESNAVVHGFDSGCTAVVALLVDKELFVANAGDSRCVICREGRALDMSSDHKPTDPEESRRIYAAGGRVSNGRVWYENMGGLNLSRAFGDHNMKLEKWLPPNEQMVTAEPEVRRHTLEPGKDEFMVLACDGIWDSLSSQQVVEFVRSRIRKNNVRLSTICEELFDQHLAERCNLSEKGCDNMTCVIVQF